MTFASCHVLSDAAVELAETDGGAKASTHEEVAEAAAELRGLHAKVYVFDEGGESHVFTGSANATNAAYGGNVEFLVELVGRRNQCGVDAILEGRGKGTGFAQLLEPYDPTAAAGAPVDDALERRLDELRREIAARAFVATIGPETEDGAFRVVLGADVGPMLPPGISASCWPITIPRRSSRPIESVWSGGADFILSREGITAFFGVELVSRELRKPVRVEFVIRAELQGAPADRLDHLLVQLLRTRGDVLRYMLFLLAGDDMALAALRGLTAERPAGGSSDDGVGGFVDLPLVEWMVKALARTPDRLAHLDRLITSLQATAEGRELLPADLAEIWEPIREAMVSAR
jgi:hypothetical protein